ncbi:hypothetical protein [Paenibacillus terrigena]|uniref:hypothetical protein n=1 Tax=Paenibacillus terrigena TaxID=369333 RepID=UPI0028D73818|nr:hypothetical protein [Paenibacillus terrigena]
MKKGFYLFLSLLVSLSLVQTASAATTSNKINPSDQLADANFSFAYMDLSGTRILSENSEDPKRFTQAIYAPGLQTSITYVKHQNRTEQDNGRQTARNFDNDEGELYQLTKGKLTENETVILASNGAFEGHTFLKYTALTKGGFTKTTIRTIEKIKKRKIAKQGLIGEVSKEVQIGLIEFKRSKGQLPLASIVLTTPKGLVFHDMPGTNDPMSTWRIEDGGEIKPSWFKVLFVSQSKSGYSLAIEGWGSEGLNIKILQQKDNIFREVASGGRYTYPV